MPVMKRTVLICLLAASLGAAESPMPAPELLPPAEIQKRAAAFKFEKGEVGGTLHDWIDLDMKTWNLALSTVPETSSVLGALVFETLFGRDPVTLEWKPCLAAEVPARSEDEDGRVWIVTLREGVAWHDGRPFGADDVIFSFNDIVLNESIRSTARPTLQMAVKDEATGKAVKKNVLVEKVDEHTVRFTIPQRYALYLNLLNGTYIYPKHLLQKQVEGGTFATAWDISTPPAEIIGTGPFMPEKRTEGKRVVLKRNPHYWKKDEFGESLPYVERWEFRVLDSADTQLARFRDGKLDYLDVRAGDVDLLAKGAAEGEYELLSTGPRASWSYLSFNQNPRLRPDGTPYVAPHKSAWFRDVRFRRAVAHCLDRDRIIREIYFGRATPLWGPFTPRYAEYYTDDVAKYPFDLAKAGALLDEMGLKDTDGDGVRDDGKGHAVEFELAVMADQPAIEAMVDVLKKDLKKAGVSLVPEYLQFNILVRRISQDWDWEAIYLAYTAGPEPLLGKSIWKTGEPRRVWNPKADASASETRDWERRIDTIFDKAYSHWDPKLHAFDRSKDVELAHEWQRICAENLPHIYLFSSASVYAISRRLGNVRTTLNSLYDPERIFIRK
ncbi:MAG: peptide/nickel transport system substrate-binding [Planctomycetota bacterium]|nr:MAG: peptide/nickel transport system substrate-binding [Planctomycetota bacterium]